MGFVFLNIKFKVFSLIIFLTTVPLFVLFLLAIILKTSGYTFDILTSKTSGYTFDILTSKTSGYTFDILTPKTSGYTFDILNIKDFCLHV